MDKDEIVGFIKIALVVAVGVFVGQLFYDWFYCLLYSFEGGGVKSELENAVCICINSCTSA